MSSNAPVPRPPSGVVVELARAGNGLQRWLRLRTLWDRVARSEGRQAELAQVGRALDDALPDAEAHARALVAYFQTHAVEINRLFGSRGKSELTEKKRRWLETIGPDYAAYGAAQAGAFASAVSAERQFVQAQLAALAGGQPMLILRGGDPFCAALDAYMLEEDTGCISGDAFACAVSAQLTEMGVDYGCL